MKIAWTIVMMVVGLALAALAAAVSWSAFRADGLVWQVPAGIAFSLAGLWFTYQAVTFHREGYR